MGEPERSKSSWADFDKRGITVSVKNEKVCRAGKNKMAMTNFQYMQIKHRGLSDLRNPYVSSSCVGWHSSKPINVLSGENRRCSFLIKLNG